MLSGHTAGGMRQEGLTGLLDLRLGAPCGGGKQTRGAVTVGEAVAHGPRKIFFALSDAMSTRISRRAFAPSLPILPAIFENRTAATLVRGVSATMSERLSVSAVLSASENASSSSTSSRAASRADSVHGNGSPHAGQKGGFSKSVKL